MLQVRISSFLSEQNSDSSNDDADDDDDDGNQSCSSDSLSNHVSLLFPHKHNAHIASSHDSVVNGDNNNNNNNNNNSNNNTVLQGSIESYRLQALLHSVFNSESVDESSYQSILKTENDIDTLSQASLSSTVSSILQSRSIERHRSQQSDQPLTATVRSRQTSAESRQRTTKRMSSTGSISDSFSDCSSNSSSSSSSSDNIDEVTDMLKQKLQSRAYDDRDLLRKLILTPVKPSTTTTTTTMTMANER